MIKVDSKCAALASLQQSTSTGTKKNVNNKTVLCPKTKNFTLRVNIFADEATLEIGRRSRTFRTIDYNAFKEYEIDLYMIAAYMHEIYSQNKINVAVVPIEDPKKGEAIYKSWQKDVLIDMTYACGKINGKGHELGSGGDFRLTRYGAEMEANFKGVIVDDSDGLMPGNSRYDYDYSLAYILSHEIIHWQLDMMNVFYLQPSDFYEVFNLAKDGKGADHAKDTNFLPHMNMAFATHYFRPDEENERILPEQICGIKIFQDDYANKINDSQKGSHWRKLADIVYAIRNQRK